MKTDPIMVPLSDEDLTLLAWLGAWTPEVHRADWPTRRAWPPGFREVVDLGVRHYKDEEAVAARLAASPNRGDWKRMWDLLAYRLVEGTRGCCRLTSRGRAALKLAGREVPDRFESHAPEVFDPAWLAPAPLPEGESSDHDDAAVWREMLTEYWEDDYQGRHTLTKARAALLLGTSTGAYLNGSMRTHHRVLSLHVENNDGREILEASLSLEQLADLLTSSGHVPITLFRYRGIDGMSRCEPAPPPVSARRRMMERLDAAEETQEGVLRKIIAKVEAANIGKRLQVDLLGDLAVALTNGRSNRAYVVTQAVNEVSMVIEGALTIAGERLALEGKSEKLPQVGVARALFGVGDDSAVAAPAITAGPRPILVATSNSEAAREAVEAIALAYEPKHPAGEVISRRAFWSEQANCWRVRLAIDSPDDPEMIFDVVDVDGPGLDGNGLDLERI